MTYLRALLVNAATIAACVSCSSAPAPEKAPLDLPAPPPPTFPDSFPRSAPPAVQRPADAPRKVDQPAVWQPRRDPQPDPMPAAASNPPEPRPAREPLREEPSLTAVADALERKLALDPRAREVRRQLVHVYLALGDWQRADAHVSQMPATTFEDRLLAACVSYRIGGPENREAMRLLAESQRDLANALPLEVRTARFCELDIPKVGRFHPLEKAEFLPGDRACLYLSFDNFALDESGGLYRVAIGFDYRILDRGGHELPWTESSGDRKEFKEDYRERVRDLCIPLRLTWPTHIGVGDYVLEVTATDRNGRRSTTQRLDFRIK